MRYVFVMSAFLGLTILIGDASAGGRPRRPKVDLEQVKDARFKAIDTDGDGTISPEEFRKAHKGSGISGTKLQEGFKKLDKDNDGKLTKAEFFGHEEAKKKDEPKKKK